MCGASCCTESEPAEYSLAMTTREQPFTLSGYHGTPTQGTATVLSFSRSERLGRAFRGLGKWWGVALLCVLIPVAHFILVPSFALYGLWQFVRRANTAELTTNAWGTCPDCSTEQSLELAPQWRAPQPVTCRHCGRGLRLA